MQKFIHAIVFACLGIALIGGVPVRASAPSSSTSVRYVYCNVYLDNACFGIAPGDTLQMEIPVDFVLDTIRLQDGAEVTIYEGDHPERVFAGESPKNCPVMNGAHQCRYARSQGQYDLLYQASNGGQLIHVRITGVTEKNQDNIKDFLSNFRQCHAVEQSMQCAEDRLFKGID